MSTKQICLIPKIQTVGGTASFQQKFAAGLESRGITVTHDPNDRQNDVVLVIGGTRHIPALIRAKKRGVPIIQRLDGMNWLHRVRFTGVRHFLRAEYGNLNLSYILRKIADTVVFQSEFARDWWYKTDRLDDLPHSVIYNGVDLEYYSPDGPEERPDDRCRLLVVEGRLTGGYESGLEIAIQLAGILVEQHGLPIELMLVGNVPERVRQRSDKQSNVTLRWAGLVPSEDIPYYDRSAHILYAADINPACPNSVIEALACGLPVAAFDTGALPELVQGDAGRVIAYGGDPWKLDPPDVPALAASCVEIFHEQAKYRTTARARAEDVFSLDDMVEKYLQVMSL